MLNDEYNKFREIGKQGSSAQFYDKQVVMRVRPRQKATSQIHRHRQESHSAPTTPKLPVNHGSKKAEVNAIREKIIESQKRSIHAYFSGHLRLDKAPAYRADPHLTDDERKQKHSNISKDYDDEDEILLESIRNKRMERMAVEGVAADEDAMDMQDLVKIHDMLDKYDAVKFRQKKILKQLEKTTTEKQKEKESGGSVENAVKTDGGEAGISEPTKDDTQSYSIAPSSAIADKPRAPGQKEPKLLLPLHDSNTSKTDAYKEWKKVDKDYITVNWRYRTSGQRQVQKVMELEKYLEEELPHCENSLARVQVYSTVFDEIIQEFAIYGPLLARVKREYDKLLTEFCTEQYELDLLRTKVKRLVSMNENRMLLKTERQKCRESEEHVENLKRENEALRAELHHKVSVYAGYLPPNIYFRYKNTDEILNNMGGQPIFKPGEDPISVCEKDIDRLTKEMQEKDGYIQMLEQERSDKFVLREESERIVTEMQEKEIKLEKLHQQNAAYAEEIKQRTEEFRALEQKFRDKEEAYAFLIKEYNELSEAVAVKFDNSLQDGDTPDINFDQLGITDWSNLPVDFSSPANDPTSTDLPPDTLSTVETEKLQ